MTADRAGSGASKHKFLKSIESIQHGNNEVDLTDHFLMPLYRPRTRTILNDSPHVLHHRQPLEHTRGTLSAS